ncbi:MAG TPA: 3-oxoacyl-[acyl-carrier-protein] synthase III C-terminal domain-containing protein [Jiangellaceae bacterium]|nr:3-oxoacyl-[acyl-carrier-protein] synthase III C-terminal domain-containing protein [Jiangellaceae bacterium]
MTRVISAATALPPHRYDQAEITAAVVRMLGVSGSRRALLERFHTASGVKARHLVLPLDRYASLDGFGAANDEFLAFAVEAGAQAVGRALAAAGLGPRDVDVLMTVSVTGIGAPSVDARLVPLLGLRDDVRRVPVFGLGCVAGAAGLARLHDLLQGDPDGVGVLLAAEACSLTVQRDDDSPANLVASALFGDGVAAVVVVGPERAARLGLTGPDIVATRSRLYPDTERVMGWDIGGSGFRIVLDPGVADVVEEHLAGDVAGLLAAHGLTSAEIARWVAHPGGPKVLGAISRALGLSNGELDVTWQSLAEVGNLSSASVLHVLENVLGQPPEPGAPGVLLAMGPGFCSELVLLRWPW